MKCACCRTSIPSGPVLATELDQDQRTAEFIAVGNPNRALAFLESRTRDAAAWLRGVCMPCELRVVGALVTLRRAT